MDKLRTNRVGEKFITKEGLTLEITEYFSCRNCTFKFEDGTIIKNRWYGDAKRGLVKNPNHRSVCGIGYLGEGVYKGQVDKIRNKSYLIWKNILLRCYETDSIKFKPTSKNCSVVEEWHNYQTFAKWFEENYVEGFELDKDIIVKGNRIYGPTTCCFVPPDINKLIKAYDYPEKNCPVGVVKRGRYFIAKISIGDHRTKQKLFKTIEEAFNYYKTFKEKHIKELAEKYKHLITDKVYESLINHKITMDNIYEIKKDIKVEFDLARIYYLANSMNYFSFENLIGEKFEIPSTAEKPNFKVNIKIKN